MTELIPRSGLERREGWCSGQCPYLKEMKSDNKEKAERLEKQDGRDKDTHEKEHEVMWKSLDGKLPRWVFAGFIVLGVAVIGSGFGFFGLELRNQRVDHTIVMKEFSTSLISMDKSLAVMSGKISNLEAQK